MVVLDEVLANLRLTRSVKKTLGFDNVYDARRKKIVHDPDRNWRDPDSD